MEDMVWRKKRELTKNTLWQNKHFLEEKKKSKKNKEKFKYSTNYPTFKLIAAKWKSGNANIIIIFDNIPFFSFFLFFHPLNVYS